MYIHHHPLIMKLFPKDAIDDDGHTALDYARAHQQVVCGGLGLRSNPLTFESLWMMHFHRKLMEIESFRGSVGLCLLQHFYPFLMFCQRPMWILSKARFLDSCYRYASNLPSRPQAYIIFPVSVRQSKFSTVTYVALVLDGLSCVSNKLSEGKLSDR